MAVKAREDIILGNALPQYLLCFTVNIISFTYGVTVGWLAPMQPLLQADYTNSTEISPLGQQAEPLTYEDISWISGTFCIGGIIGTPLYGYLANVVGRKKSALLMAIPFVITYIMILFAVNPLMIFIGRFFAGLGGGGVCVIGPMYVGETAEVRNRGILGSFFNLFLCVGILLSFIIGSYTSYLTLGLFCIAFPTSFIILWFWIPETPIYLLLKNQADDAKKTLKKLWGNHPNLIESEIKSLTLSLKEMSSSKRDKKSFREYMSESATKKGFIIGGVIMTVQQMSGVSPILNYTVAIFQASGSELSPNVAAIIVGTIQVIGAIAATITMEKAGRKILLMISSTAMAISLAPIAIFFYLKNSGWNLDILKSIGWIPVTCLAIFIIGYGLGFGPVPFVLIGEIFNAEVRSVATSFSTFLIWAEAFILLKFFSKISDLIGIETCFGMFSICCALGTAFTYFYIPETKGKTLDQILFELGGKEPLNNLEKESPIPLFNLEGNYNYELHNNDRTKEK